MKSILFLLVFAIMTVAAQAQMTNVYRDDQFSVSRTYAGMYSTTVFPTDSLSGIAQINLRLGFKSELKLTDALQFKTWGAIQIEKNMPTAGYNSFELQIKPTKNLSLSTGLIATPTTVLRPNPTTWESQIETHTQSTIIPGKPGTKVSYTLTENSSITYGYFNHGDDWAHHLNLSIHDWHVAGYSLNNGEYFAALAYQKAWLDHTIAFSSENQMASSAFINLKNEVSFVLDAQYAFNQDELEFFQVGLRKYIVAQQIHLRGFFGMAYDWKTELILSQVFISLF